MKTNPQTSSIRYFAALFMVLFTLFSSESLIHAQDAKPAQAGKSYRLQAGDSFTMSVFGEGDIGLTSKIGKTGALSFPLIGQVDIRGLTVPEAEQKLRELYMKDYYVDPKISLLITGYHTKRFHISGAVEHPGSHAFPEEGGINLGQAVAMCGGIDQDGDIKAITVFKRKIAGFKTYDLASQGGVELDPGDTLVVPRLPSRNISYVATVSGEVGRPGDITLGDVGKIDILTALARAGGFSRIANQKEGIIQRRTKDGFKMETVRMKDIRDGKIPMVFINEGDILIIKESRW